MFSNLSSLLLHLQNRVKTRIQKAVLQAKQKTRNWRLPWKKPLNTVMENMEQPKKSSQETQIERVSRRKPQLAQLFYEFHQTQLHKFRQFHAQQQVIMQERHSRWNNRLKLWWQTRPRPTQSTKVILIRVLIAVFVVAMISLFAGLWIWKHVHSSTPSLPPKRQPRLVCLAQAYNAMEFETLSFESENRETMIDSTNRYLGHGTQPWYRHIGQSEYCNIRKQRLFRKHSCKETVDPPNKMEKPLGSRYVEIKSACMAAEQLYLQGNGQTTFEVFGYLVEIIV